MAYPLDIRLGFEVPGNPVSLCLTLAVGLGAPSQLGNYRCSNIWHTGVTYRALGLLFWLGLPEKGFWFWHFGSGWISDQVAFQSFPFLVSKSQ